MGGPQQSLKLHEDPTSSLEEVRVHTVKTGRQAGSQADKL